MLFDIVEEVSGPLNLFFSFSFLFLFFSFSDWRLIRAHWGETLYPGRYFCLYSRIIVARMLLPKVICPLGLDPRSRSYLIPINDI